MEQRFLIPTLQNEQKYHIKGGIYHKLQVDFAYNSNHIEGSQLSHEQTQYIYDTKTVGIEPARVDDIFETVNHLRCFDMMLQNINEPLTEDFIKSLHRVLKTGTFSSQAPQAAIGEYKQFPNFVNDMKTTHPKNVASELRELLQEYNNKHSHSFEDILDFHARYEKIHPFYDGNGRTGRFIMFRECLHSNIVPFIITGQYKGDYYRGLKEWQTGGEKGYLLDTCLFMQDNMKKIMEYFEISYYDDSLTPHENYDISSQEDVFMVQYRTLSADEICRSLFQDFIRHQIVTKCWRKENGRWIIKDDPFVDDWGEEEYQILVSCLKHTASSGGFVCGAFVEDKLKGFVSVEAELFGGEEKYLDLTSIHTSEDMRGKGIGTALFLSAKEWAGKKGAKKLYISAHSAVESQAFYQAMGCVEAKVYHPGHVEQEPCDCQLEISVQ